MYRLEDASPNPLFAPTISLIPGIMLMQHLIIRVPRAKAAFRGLARALASPLGLASGTPLSRLICICETISPERAARPSQPADRSRSMRRIP